MYRGQNKMKKLICGTSLLALMFLFPLPMMAEMNISIGISTPPMIRFSGPPRLVMLPDSYVYVSPDIEEEIFFYDGFWWRPWEGRWYRSHDYNSGWYHYRNVPSFYRNVPRHWRNDYRERHWQGRQWAPEPRPHYEVQRHWIKNTHQKNNRSWDDRNYRDYRDRRDDHQKNRRPWDDRSYRDHRDDRQPSRNMQQQQYPRHQQ